MNFIKRSLAFLWLFLAAGCIHRWSVDFDMVKPGQTSRPDLIAMFGEPDDSMDITDKSGRRFTALFYMGFSEVAFILIDPATQLVHSLSKGPGGEYITAPNK